MLMMILWWKLPFLFGDHFPPATHTGKYPNKAAERQGYNPY